MQSGKKESDSGLAHYVVAAIAKVPGIQGALWRTRAEVLNPFPSAQELRLEFHVTGMETLVRGDSRITPGLLRPDWGQIWSRAEPEA